MIYIIDHKDSFTHNVVHQFENFDDVYCDNFNDIKQCKLNKAKVVVFSPGPGSPKDYPNSSKIYKELKGKKKKFKEMRKENSKFWKDVMTEDIFAIEGMQAGRSSPIYNGGNFSPIMDNPTHQFHQWIAKNLIN